MGRRRFAVTVLSASFLAACGQPVPPSVAPDWGFPVGSQSPVVAEVGALPFCLGVTGPVLVFAGSDDTYEGVNLFSVDVSGAVRQLTDDQSSNAPSFSADGTQIVFSRSLDHRAGGGAPSPGTSVWTLEPSDGSERLITEAFLVNQPRLSPDGARVVFSGLLTSEDGVPGQRIYLVGSSGGEPEPLSVAAAPPYSDGAFTDYAPAWSNTGDQIAFVRSGTRGGPNQVWVIDLASGLGRIVFESAELPVGLLTWTASDDQLIFGRYVEGGTDRDLIAVDIEDGAIQVLASSVYAYADTRGQGLIYLTQAAPGATDYTLNYLPSLTGVPVEARLLLPAVHPSLMSARTCS